MKICILTHTYPRFDGDTSAPFMYGVAKGMAEAGNDVYVLTPYSEKFALPKKQPFKVLTYKYIWPDSLHKLGYSETLTNDMGFPLIMWFLSPFMYIFGFFKLLNLINEKKIEIINAHWILPNGFIASVVSLITRTPVVSTLPGSDVYMVAKNPFFNLLGKFAAGQSKWITSNSGQLIADLEKETHLNLDKKSSSIIYGVDPEKFKENNSGVKGLKRKLNIDAKDIVVVGVGRLVAKKGFRYLIEASKLILKKNIHITFVIVGDGDERIFLENLARKLKVYNNFRFVGNINYKDLIHYYNLGDIFILPSVRDEKGNLDDQSVSVIEAMSSGTPVITTDFPGYRSVIKDGETGFLIKEKDYKKIAEKIIFMAKNKKARGKMGRDTRQSVLNNFSWKAIGRQYANLFKKINNKYYSVGVPKILNEKGRVAIAKQILGVLKHEVQDTKKLNCLDVGASSGAIANYLADYFKSVKAIDIDENAIDIAKEKYNKKNLSFEVGNIEKMEFKSESYDVVICNQVYNFVDDPKKLMDEIYRVLKPGGVCFFGARNKYAIMEPQYDLPFLSLFSGILPFGKNYMDYNELKELTKKFEVKDYTIIILKNPSDYNFKKLEKYSPILKMLPLNLFRFFIPNYIWVLKKSAAKA